MIILQEVQAGMKKLKNRRSLGIDNISNEMMEDMMESTLKKKL